MRRGCGIGCLGLVGLLGIFWLIGTLTPRSSTPPDSAAPTGRTAAPQYQVASVGEISFTNQLRVGAPGVIRFTLRNDGDTTPKEVRANLDAGLFDGLIFESATPARPRESNILGRRSFRWDGLAPGEEQAYELRLVGKTAGEYRFNIFLLADEQEVRTGSGRIVVLP